MTTPQETEHAGSGASPRKPFPQDPREKRAEDPRIAIKPSIKIDLNEIDLIQWDFDGTVIDTEKYHVASFFGATERLLGVKLTEKARKDLLKDAIGHGELHDSLKIFEYVFQNWREMGVDPKRLIALQDTPEIEFLLERGLQPEEQIERYLERDLSAEQMLEIAQRPRCNKTVFRLAKHMLYMRPKDFMEALVADPSAELRPGVQRLLEQAQESGIRCGIVTGSSFYIVEGILDHFDLQHLFDPKLRFYSPSPGGVDPKDVKPGHEPESYEHSDCKPAHGCYTKGRIKAEAAPERTLILENSGGGIVSAVDSLSRDNRGRKIFDDEGHRQVVGHIVASPDGDFFDQNKSRKENAGVLCNRAGIELDKNDFFGGKNLLTVIESKADLQLIPSRSVMHFDEAADKETGAASD